MRDDDPKDVTPPVAPEANPATEEIARVEPHPTAEASAPPNLPEFTPSTSGTASPLPRNHVSFLPEFVVGCASALPMGVAPEAIGN